MEIILLLILVSTASSERVKRIVGGRAAERLTSAPTKPSVHLEPLAILYDASGAVGARVHGILEDSTRPPFYSFLGLRYAEPPVQRRRFQRPSKLRLSGEVDARRTGAPCIQPHPQLPFKTIGSEDCLFLNVHTPTLPDVRVSNFARKRSCEEDDLLPVMVWIHGGGYRQGSANQYGPKYLVQKGIVVVTIQYRLGSLGFLSHGDKDSPGNAALCDQLTALEWVKEHISAFGGDPNKVSVGGHDAGGSSVMLLSQSRYGSGLFRSVVAMSGSSLSAWATEMEPWKEAGYLSKRVKCPTNNSTEAVKCLKEISAEKLVIAESEMKDSSPDDGDLTQLFPSSAPVVDGPTDFRFHPTILPEDPKEGLEEGLIPPIPLLTGITKDETSNLFSAQQTKEIMKKIEEIPNYLNEIFLPRLVKTTKGLANLTDLVKGTLTNYLQFMPGNKGPLAGLVEVSTDVLFALPVFLTSSLWKRSGGNVYLYSFDHPSPYSASVFSSSPFKTLTDAIGTRHTRQVSQKDNSVGHGEDLFYLFEPKSLEGESLPEFELNTTEDKNVLDLLSSTVAKFVKNGNPSMELDGQQSPWLPFSDDENNYLSISNQPKVGTQFKFCEIGLWGGKPSRLLTPECRDAFDPVALLQGVPDAFSGLLGNSGTPKPSRSGGIQFPGLLG